MDKSFEFNDVSIKFNNKTIWSEGNFKIKKGTITAIIGSNGAGKTTLIKIITGLIKPTTGKVSVFDKKIGYVPQNSKTENDFMLRGIDYIKAVSKNTNKEQIKKIVKLVNIETIIKQRISTLSGGQKQKIFIAAALVNEEELLIFDEPLSSLDIKTAKEIVALIEKINKKTKKTILIVAHDLGILLPILTGAIYLLDGHAHYTLLDDAEHSDYGDLLEHLKTMKVGDHSL